MNVVSVDVDDTPTSPTLPAPAASPSTKQANKSSKPPDKELNNGLFSVAFFTHSSPGCAYYYFFGTWYYVCDDGP